MNSLFNMPIELNSAEKASFTKLIAKNPRFSKNIKYNQLNSLKIEPTQARKFNETLSNVTGISYLEFSLDYSTKSDIIKTANIILKKAKCLQKLSVKIAGLSIDQKALEELLRAISSCSKLKAVELNLSNSAHLSDASLLLIIKYIKKVSGLESIHLNFSRDNQLSEEGIKQFFIKLHEIRYVKTLSINMTNITLPGRIMESLAIGLRGFQNLQEFQLFMRNSNLRGVFGFCLFETLAQLKKLTKITLDFPFVFNFDENCPLASNLSSLSLNLFNCAIGTSYLCEAFGKLKGLKHLSCDLSQNALNGKTIKTLFNGIQKIETLETLELILNGNKIEDVDFSELDRLENLKTFKLSCGKKLNFNFNKNAENLIKNLKFISKVEDLELCISDKLSQECFYNLINAAMNQLINLEELILYAPKTKTNQSINKWLEGQIRNANFKRMECVLSSWELRI